jgi:hypothetical protein
MSYVDAGYASALGVLFLYGAGLLLRRRRLERALRNIEEVPPPVGPGGAS